MCVYLTFKSIYVYEYGIVLRAIAFPHRTHWRQLSLRIEWATLYCSGNVIHFQNWLINPLNWLFDGVLIDWIYLWNTQFDCIHTMCVCVFVRFLALNALSNMFHVHIFKWRWKSELKAMESERVGARQRPVTEWMERVASNFKVKFEI